MIKLRNIINESSVAQQIPSHVQSVNDVRDYIKNLSTQERNELQKNIDQINQQYENMVGGMLVLYHGTSKKIADQIRNKGFKLTKGRRSGFFGDIKHVDNLAIFLSDSKNAAWSYGHNRSDNGDVDVIEVRANINNILDMTQNTFKHIPNNIKKQMINAISDYEGKKIYKPRQSDMYWLVDQKNVVDAIKSAGYDSVKFNESSVTSKELDIGNIKHTTYGVFNPSLLHVYKKPISKLSDLIPQ